MEDSHLDIDLVGKYLVHYKLIKHQAKRTAMSLSSIKAVEKYLKDNKAVLVPG
jgi:ribosomal protein L18E